MAVSLRDDVPVEFVASYDGEALRQHTMPVRDLAPALLALGQAFDRANTVLNGDSTALTLEIRATTTGSFEVTLVLQQAALAGALFLTPDFLSTANTIKELVFGGHGIVGVFGLFKRFRGKRPKVVAETPDGSITLEFDRVRLRVPSEVWQLYLDVLLRQYLEAVTRPLAKPGIDTLTFRENNENKTPLETVTKEDVPAFTQGDAEVGAPSQTFIPKQRLQPGTVNLNNMGAKWRMSDGEISRQYTISDAEFLGQVARGERRFGSGDTLVCDVLMRQWDDAQGKLRTEHEIIRVLDHITGPRQARLIEEDR